MKHTWRAQRPWLLGGLLLASLALVIIALLWAIQAHQYQLDLANYNATHQPIQLPTSVSERTGSGTLNFPGQPPIDTSGPDGWGAFGWTIRLLTIVLPALLGVALDWRAHHQRVIHTQKTHLAHATSKLAEAITADPGLPENVLDAYSKLRELEP
jgi:hypothetical protein